MRCYLVCDHQVAVLPHLPACVPADALLIQRSKELDPLRFPLVRLLALWNALPGVDPLKRFPSRAAAIQRVWAAFEALPLSTVHADSKQALLIALLRRPSGASMEELIRATVWQPHSVHGVLSGVLRKKRGLAVCSERVGDSRIYRIAA